MYGYIYIYIYTHIYVCIYIYICMYFSSPRFHNFQDPLISWTAQIREFHNSQSHGFHDFAYLTISWI